MAGLGRRTFAPGEVLTASNVMNYLQDQAVMNFAGTAARGSAIGTAVSEGMVSYLNDTDNLEVYQAIGTAAPGWNPVAFRSEVASLAISGLVPAVPSSVTIATGSGSANALGQVSFTGATSVSLNGVFTSTYKSYRVIILVDSNSVSTSNVSMRYRASGTDFTTALYQRTGLATRTNVSSATIGQTGQTSIAFLDVGSNTGFATIEIKNPVPAVWTESLVHSSGIDATTAFNMVVQSGLLPSNTSFDGFSIIPASGNITGTVQVFGYND
jgi:hypothetical protein